ncbi:MAG TPA: ABC-F family ATP-binding cassette domain-containing protein [Methanomassiliicoccales archaeon]|nr:ABC-F family ATP-binding cassette domain-containing protein [Methanomassiliicoccales archaeon]
MLLKASGISKSFGPNDVLRSVDVEIDKGDRVGLVGPNGAGKSTLLKILTGDLRPDIGDVVRGSTRIAYLPQFQELGEATVEEVVSDEENVAALARIEELERLMAESANDPSIDIAAVAQEYARLQEQLVSRREHEFEARKQTALARVGMIGREEQSVAQMSGGETTRVLLARALMQAEEADLLILDEPTSHLDIETIESLEEYLRRFEGAVIVVSHDRYFLDRVVTAIWDLDRGRLRDYRGSYTEYVAKKALEVEKQRIAAVKSHVERERLMKAAEEQHLRLRYASTHKVTQRRAERIEEIESPGSQRRIRVSVEAAEKSGKNMITVAGMTVRRGPKLVLNNVELDLLDRDKLGVFGPNGAGKSTLIKAILGELPFTGDVWIAPGAEIGYFAQGHESLDHELTAEEQLAKALGEKRASKARALLARFLFDDAMMRTKISALSGGERARVALAMLIAEEHNLLLLDEPTNYLDLDSKEAVQSALVDYQGTMILVTHDRYLLDALCNKVAEIRGGKMRVFFGSYTEMRKTLGPMDIIAEGAVYRVVSSFTDWATHTRYRPGDKVAIAPSEIQNFQWALDAGKLRKMGGTEIKKVRKHQ